MHRTPYAANLYAMECEYYNMQRLNMITYINPIARISKMQELQYMMLSLSAEVPCRIVLRSYA